MSQLRLLGVRQAGVVGCVVAAALTGLVGPGAPTAAAAPPAGVLAACAWTPEILPTLGSGLGEIRGADAAGTVWAGVAVDRLGVHAALWRGGAITDLGTSVTGAAEALDVSRQGVAVGDIRDADGFSKPMMWRNGQSIRLALPPNSTGGSASGINDAGLIVGGVDLAGVPHAVAWLVRSPDRFADLGTAGGAGTGLSGVSADGTLAGQTTRNDVDVALTGTLRTGLRALPGTAPAENVTAGPTIWACR